MPGWLDPWATRVRLKEAQEEEERAAQPPTEVQGAQVQQDLPLGVVKKLEIEHELAWRTLPKHGSRSADVCPRAIGLGQWTSDGQATNMAAAKQPVLRRESDPLGPVLEANVIPICL